MQRSSVSMLSPQLDVVSTIRAAVKKNEEAPEKRRANDDDDDDDGGDDGADLERRNKDLRGGPASSRMPRSKFDTSSVRRLPIGQKRSRSPPNVPERLRQLRSGPKPKS